MKIYNPEPLHLIQLTFRRGTEKVIYLTLCDTDIHSTKNMLEYLFTPIETTKKSKDHKKTRIEIRERIGGENGKYKAVSFYGESAAETKEILTKYINAL